MPLPSTPRLLLGPGPSPVSPRVLDALGAPHRSHLDPDLTALLDDIRARLRRVAHASEDAVSLAISGTGTAGLEAVAANLVEPGRQALVVVNGYFGDRLAQVIARHGATVDRLEGEWGRAIDPDVVRRKLAAGRYDLVGVVHGETSTGVVNPVETIGPLAADHDALVVVDAVTSLGAVPVLFGHWQIDACYSCTQKGLGAPSGLSPVLFSERALARKVTSRSFYLDLDLLMDYWVRRKYHHTISTPLVYALDEALAEVEDEGLEVRWARHARVHQAFADGLDRLGLSLVPPPGERLFSLNTVRVPNGVDDVAVRKRLLHEHGIEIGAGLGPLAGKIFRVGLMGSGATIENVDKLLSAFGDCLRG